MQGAAGGRMRSEGEKREGWKGREQGVDRMRHFRIPQRRGFTGEMLRVEGLGMRVGGGEDGRE